MTENPMDNAELLTMQEAYKAAVNQWVTAIRAEEELAWLTPTLAQVDNWEEAHFREEDARNKAKKAKAAYESAIRQKLFHF